MSIRDSGAEPTTALGSFCDRAIEAGWLTVLAAIPLYFDVYSSRVFEPDKTIILRGLVLLMLLAQLIRFSEGDVRPASVAGSTSSGSLLRRWAATNPLFVPIAILVAVETLATVTSIAPSVSLFGSYQRLQGTYTFFTYLALFFLVVANLRRAEQTRRVVLVVLLTSLPISLYGIVQHLQLDPLPWGGDVVFRVTSTMGNAIFLSAYLILVIPLTAARLTNALARLQRAEPRSNGLVSRVVLTWLGVVIGQNVLLACLLVGSSSLQSIWWVAPGMIGVFVLLATLPGVAPRDRDLARVEAIALTALLCLQVVVVFLTQSRGPWLGLLAGGIVFVLLLELWSKAQRRLLFATLGGIVIVGAFLAVFNLPGSPLAKYRDLPYVGRLGQLSEVNDGTGRVRVLIWQGTLDLLTHHPNVGLSPDPLGGARLLIGYGPEAMHLAYNVVYPPALGDLESRNASPDRNHNDLLDYVVTTGLIGLAAYFALIVAVVRLGWQTYRRSRSFADVAFLAGLLAAIAAHLIETQTGIAVVSTQTYFWILLALLVVVARQPELARDLPGRAIAELVPLAGGAPSPPRQRKSGRRAQPAPPPPPAPTPPARAPGLPFWAPITAYLVIVVGIVRLTTLLADLGVLGAQVMMYVSFLTLGGALVVYGLRGDRSQPIVRARSRSFWVAVVGGAAVAIAIGLNLNGVAADVYQKQGTTLDGAQRYADSTRAFANALALSPTQDYYALFLGRAYLQVATANTNPPPPQPATSASHPTIATLFTISPTAVGQLSRGDALALAEVALSLAHDLGPLDPDHYANLARLYRLWGETTDPSKLPLAATYIADATSLSPHSAALYDEWAVTLISQGNLPGAQAKAQTAIALDPAYAAPHLILGDVYLEEKEVDRALAEHLVALGLDPTVLSDGTFEKRVATYVAAGKGPILSETYRKLAAQSPSRTVRLSYAFILTQLGQNASAIEQFRAVLAANPTDWITARNLAIAYARGGDKSSARAAATQALQYAPSNQRQDLQTMIASLGP